MGLDMYIDARRNIGTPNEERQEKVYWRKFWDLQDYIVKITDGKIDQKPYCRRKSLCLAVKNKSRKSHCKSKISNK